MTAEQFTYWLQGYAELNAGPPSAEQWQAIRDHLAVVFRKVTPPVGKPILDWTWADISEELGPAQVLTT